MKRIEALSENAIRLIRAGEVVTSPASVVCELIGNSLDAGSSVIEVSLSADTRNICVSDDGTGIAEDQLEIALQEHTTSKFTDMKSIGTSSTNGFRGEALHAMTEMANLKMVSRVKGEESWGITKEVGKAPEISPRPYPVEHGTSVVVEKLFETHTPRLLQMKRPGTEASRVKACLTSWALFHNAEFRYTWRRKGNPDTLHIKGDYRSRIQALSKEDNSVIAWVDYRSHDSIAGEVHITGAILATSGKYFSINKRPVSHTGFVDAGVLGVGRLTGFALNVAMNEKMVDVNIHPEKKEVSCRGDVPGIIYDALRAAAERDDTGLKAVIRNTRENITSNAVGGHQDKSRHQAQYSRNEYPGNKYPGNNSDNGYIGNKKFDHPFSENSLSARNLSNHNFSGHELPNHHAVYAPTGCQKTGHETRHDDDTVSIEKIISGKYGLASYRDRTFICDIHAAHERMIFDQTSQLLYKMFVPLSLNACDEQKLWTLISGLSRQGWCFDEDENAITQAPVPDSDAHFVLKVLLKTDTNLMHDISCHHAWKKDSRKNNGSYVDNYDEKTIALFKAIIRYGIEEGRLCVHGRPVCYEMTEKTLENLFERD